MRGGRNPSPCETPRPVTLLAGPLEVPQLEMAEQEGSHAGVRGRGIPPEKPEAHSEGRRHQGHVRAARLRKTPASGGQLASRVLRRTGVALTRVRTSSASFRYCWAGLDSGSSWSRGARWNVDSCTRTVWWITVSKTFGPKYSRIFFSRIWCIVVRSWNCVITTPRSGTGWSLASLTR